MNNKSVTFPVTIPVTATANSVITLVAHSTDNAGNTSLPVSLNLVIADVIKPSVTLSMRPGMTTIARGSSFTATVTASDNVGMDWLTVRTTGAYVSTQNKSFSVAKQLTHTFVVNVPLSAAAGGVITVTGEAEDTTDNVGQSAPLTLTVVNPSAQVSGLVRDASNNPVAGADVFVQAPNGIFTATTGADGFYGVSGTADGKIIVEARHLPTGSYGKVSGTLSANAGLTLNVGLSTAILMQSTFDDGDEGWTLVGNGSLVAANPYLYIHNQGGGATSYFAAPAKFLGNFSAAYGKSLEFTLLKGNLGTALVDSDLILSGAGMTLHYTLNKIPGNGWTSYSVPLDLSTLGWHVNSLSGRQPSEAELRAVLADLRGLWVRGDYLTANHVIYLDTVIIRTPTTRVQGMVTDVNGLPLPNALVTMTASSGVYVLRIDGDGRYDVRGLAYGNVAATATRADGLRRSTSIYLPSNGSVTLNVALLAAPVVSISHPVGGNSILEGAPLPITVTASSGVGLARVIFYLDGKAIFTDTTAPYRTDIVVPQDVPNISLGARAEDTDGNATLAANVVLTVLDDARTEVRGRVVDGSNGNAPVAGATVTWQEFSAVSDSEGNFSMTNVPTARGALTLLARKTINGRTLQATATVNPVASGITEAGDLILGINKFWVGGVTGLWHTASNWNEGKLPDGTSDVYIPITATVEIKADATINSLNGEGSVKLTSGTLTVNADSMPAALHVNGGTLSGAGTITVTNAFTWTSGTLGNGGRLVAQTSLLLDGTSTRNLYRTVINRGNGVWRNNTIRTYTGAVLINETGATLTTQGDLSLSYWSSDISVFENRGTLIHTANPTTTPATVGQLNIYATFNNSGTVLIEKGSLWARYGGTQSGTVTVATGATYYPNYYSNLATTFTANSLVQGGGRVEFTNNNVTLGGRYNITGTTLLSGGNVTLQSNITLPHLEMTAGSLSGTGAITVTNAFTWTSGNLNAGGKLVTEGRTLINGNNTRNLYRSWQNRGHAIWMMGSLRVFDGATLTNESGATLDLQGDVTWNWYTGNSSVLDNRGTILRTVSNGTATLEGTVNNSGSIKVQTGTLHISYQGTHNGSLEVNSGATLKLGLYINYIYTLAAGSTVQGAGTVQFVGSTVNVNGIYNVTGTTTATGGTTIFGPTATVTSVGNTLSVSGGTLNLGSHVITAETLSVSGSSTLIMNGASTFNNVTAAAGTLSGSGDMTVNNTLAWTGGATLSGTGRTTVNGALNIINTGTSPKYLSERTLINRGTGLWSDSGIRMTYGAKLINESGATFEIRGDLLLDQYNGAVSTFENRGTLIRSAGTGVATLEGIFINTGTVTVGSGTLEIAADGSNTGALNVNAGTRLRFKPTGTFTLGGSLASSGIVEISGGSVRVDNALTAPTLEINAGTLTGSGDVTVGTLLWTQTSGMSGTGRTIVTGNMSIDVIGLGSLVKTLDGRTLINRGAALWKKGEIDVKNGALIINDLGATLEIQTDNELDFPSNSGAQPVFENRGTLRKTAGAATGQTFDTVVYNSGTLAITGGMLSLTKSYSQTADGVLTLAVDGATAGSQLHQLKVTGAATLSGTLSITRTNGFTPNVGESFAVITYGSRSGSFGAVTGTAIGTDRQFQIRYDDAGKRVMLDVAVKPAAGSAGEPTFDRGITTTPPEVEMPPVNPEPTAEPESTPPTIFLPMLNGGSKTTIESDLPMFDPGQSISIPVQETPEGSAVEPLPTPTAQPVEDAAMAPRYGVFLPYIMN